MSNYEHIHIPYQHEVSNNQVLFRTNMHRNCFENWASGSPLIEDEINGRAYLNTKREAALASKYPLIQHSAKKLPKI